MFVSFAPVYRRWQARIVCARRFLHRSNRLPARAGFDGDEKRA